MALYKCDSFGLNVSTRLFICEINVSFKDENSPQTFSIVLSANLCPATPILYTISSKNLFISISRPVSIDLIRDRCINFIRNL